MANETLAQIPSDVSDPVALKRFLSTLVERLDTVLGYRGDTAYASDTNVKDLATSIAENLTTANEAISTVQSDIKSVTTDVADHEERLTSTEERLTSTEEQLGQLQAYASTVLRDFNAEGWPVYSFFTCLGSEALNPPTALTTTDTYSFFSSVLPSHTQTVIMLDSTGASNQFVRSGLTWSEVAANGWLSL